MTKRNKYLFFGTIILIVVSATLFCISPAKCINTIRFFPKYNPFATQLVDKLPTSQDDPKLNTALQESTLEKTTLPFQIGPDRNVIIYLPKGYDKNNPKHRFPVLYMLHGSPGQETDWLQGGDAEKTLDKLIDNKTIPPLIVVFPDGNGGVTKDTQYINSFDGKQRNEDFIVKTVVGYIDKNYLTLPSAKYRAIGGLSSGGYGALNLSLKHQDVFGYAIVLSGYGNIDKNYISNELIHDSVQIIHDNSPEQYIPSLKATSTKVVLIFGKQDELYQDNLNVYNELKNAGFPVEQQVYDGVHNWVFWSDHFDEGLLWLDHKMDN
jgi:enterochelin esterase-like enzyme